MPIFSYSAEQAFANRRKNDCATWPERGLNNRIEPIARLKVQAPFTLEPGSSIFTVGSCFARNVEAYLRSAKFRVPALDLLDSPIFKGVPRESINNFSAPSIFNEFHWALEDDAGFDPDVHCFETTGGFIDLHLGGTQKVLPLETVKERRNAVSQTYRSVTTCDAIIMTLGLSEVWFDTKSGFYINHTPFPNITRLAPGRFELHVLSYEEVKSYIFRAIDLIVRHSEKPPRIILTVSPVPLMSTFRENDVAVANAYSKAVLRAVSEEIAGCYDFVSYFPSFESVGLSDRGIAWMPDQVHVTQDIVAVQVARMLNAYAPYVQLPEVDGLDAGAVIERANSAMTPLEARLFFQEHFERHGNNPSFLVPYIRYLFATNEPLVASVLGDRLEGRTVEERILKAKGLRLTSRPAEGLKWVEPVLTTEQRSSDVWEEAVLGYAALGDLDNALRVGKAWFAHLTYDATARPRVARAIARLDMARATELLAEAEEMLPDNYLVKVVRKELEALAGSQLGEIKG